MVCAYGISHKENTMNGNLLILGAGMFGTVVKELARETGLFDKIDFLDDSFGTQPDAAAYHEESIGKLADCKGFLSEYPFAIVSIGNTKFRAELTTKLKEAGFRIPSIVSGRAYVSPSAALGAGTVVCPMAVVNPNAAVGEGSFVLAGSVVDHNAVVSEYCNIQCGAVVAPGAYLPAYTMVQPNDVIRKTDFASEK